MKILQTIRKHPFQVIICSFMLCYLLYSAHLYFEYKKSQKQFDSFAVLNDQANKNLYDHWRKYALGDEHRLCVECVYLDGPNCFGEPTKIHRENYKKYLELKKQAKKSRAKIKEYRKAKEASKSNLRRHFSFYLKK